MEWTIQIRRVWFYGKRRRRALCQFLFCSSSFCSTGEQLTNLRTTHWLGFHLLVGDFALCIVQSPRLCVWQFAGSEPRGSYLLACCELWQWVTTQTRANPTTDHVSLSTVSHWQLLLFVCCSSLLIKCKIMASSNHGDGLKEYFTLYHMVSSKDQRHLCRFLWRIYRSRWWQSRPPVAPQMIMILDLWYYQERQKYCTIVILWEYSLQFHGRSFHK